MPLAVGLGSLNSCLGNSATSMPESQIATFTGVSSSAAVRVTSRADQISGTGVSFFAMYSCSTSARAPYSGMAYLSSTRVPSSVQASPESSAPDLATAGSSSVVTSASVAARPAMRE